MTQRIGKYKVSKKEQAIYEHDVQNGTFTNMDLGGTLEVDGISTLTGVATLAAKSVHTAALSATTGNIECVVGTLDLQNGGTISQGGGAKTTTVVLSTSSGQITMDDAELAAAAEVSFTVTNTLVAATDVVVACHGSGGTAGAYMVQANSIGSGSYKITVTNLSAGALSEAIVINVAHIKGASS